LVQTARVNLSPSPREALALTVKEVQLSPDKVALPAVSVEVQTEKKKESAFVEGPATHKEPMGEQEMLVGCDVEV
jgi:hypothetical protein